MISNAPYQPPGPPPALGIVDRVIAYVDRPWKIAAVVVLGLTLVIGVTVWEKRGEFAMLVLEQWVTVRLQPQRFPKLAQRLISETGADVVVLAEISARTNLIRNIDGAKRGDPGWESAKNPRALFDALRPPNDVVELIEGRVVCRDVVTQNGGLEDEELSRLGMQRRCYVGIPPVLDVMVGGIEIAWRVPLTKEAEAGAGKLLWQAASELATW